MDSRHSIATQLPNKAAKKAIELAKGRRNLSSKTKTILAAKRVQARDSDKRARAAAKKGGAL